MSLSNPELRAELTGLTNPPPGVKPEWLDVQVRQIEELKARYPHTIRLHTKNSPAINELSCFMCALGIEADAVRYMCSKAIFPGSKFVQFLLEDGHLYEMSAPDANGLIVYFCNGAPVHAGNGNDQIVVSKWGSGITHIWEHPLWEVPDTYGYETRFFKPLPEATEIYLQWAADHGL